MGTVMLAQPDGLMPYHPANGRAHISAVAANDPRAQAVVNALREHGNTRKACLAAGVPMATFYDWKDSLPALSDQYMRAKEIGLQCAADKAMEDALNAKDAGLGRLALDAHKWYLGKLLPRIFGDNQRIEHAGKLDVDVTDNSERLQELARVMRQDKRLAPPIEGEVIRRDAKPKPRIDAPVPRVEDAPEDISDLI